MLRMSVRVIFLIFLNNFFNFLCLNRDILIHFYLFLRDSYQKNQDIRMCFFSTLEINVSI